MKFAGIMLALILAAVIHTEELGQLKKSVDHVLENVKKLGL